MDYFSKFKKRIAPPKVQPTSALQLVKFHKCWDYVHNIFIAEDRKINLHIKQTEIPERLRQMVDMLVDEEARQEDNTTGVCMEYFLKHGVLQYLVNVSEKMDYPEGIRGESIRTIASMVDLLDDRFLVHNAVHKPTIKLLRFCVLDERQSELDHEDLVDLMYIICSKIHGFPALLNIFFHDKQWLTTPQKTSTTTTTTSALDAPLMMPMAEIQAAPPEYEFLLFTYLLRYIHREGRSGDYARTGLLFLMEMATDQLGDFILESDFATIMAAGLGALYSQLPRKLIIKDESEINSTAASYLLGQDLDPRSFPSDEFGVEQSNSAQFKYQLDSFLKLLEFCQDVLLRCPNDAISKRLLQCTRGIFMENILYPSILECSDIDGSSVAVISYIDLILQIVQQQDLATVIVGFLMDDTDDEEHIVDKLTMAPPTNLGGIELGYKSTPYYTAAERFTLKDLIFTRLKSSSQPTVIATLKLLKTLIVKHCRFADRLLSTVLDRKADNEEKPPSTNISHHMREIQLYFSLISAIDQVHADDILTLGYEDYLEDVKTIMQQDICYQCLIESPYDKHPVLRNKPVSSKSDRRRSKQYEDAYHQYQHRIMSDALPLVHQRIQSADTLVQLLLGLLSHFFAQSSQLNLALTNVISALALCPYRSLEGWITFSDSDRTNDNDILNLGSNSGAGSNSTNPDMPITNDPCESQSDLPQEDDDDDRSLDFGAERNSARMTTPTQFKSFPPFYTLLRTLTQQVDYYRSEVDGFDVLLDERWNGLLLGQPTTVAAAPTPSLSSSVRRASADPQPTVSASTATAGAASIVSKLFGLGSSTSTTTQSSAASNILGTGGNGAAQQPSKRRNSVASLKPSTSATTANLSNSLSSSTMAPALLSASSVVGSSVGGGSGNGGGGGGAPGTPGAAATASSFPPVPPAIHPLSPLALHAKKTLQVHIQPLFPSNFEIDRDPILNLDADDEDVFAPTQHPSQRRKDKSTEISLSMLLNNVVILEETIKELVAIMQVRRSLGIDRIRYT
ncbi:Retinoic acid induced 16-like protein-domain-containing protein [Parasitella parasitica]|nr:Retinoic acid induced 16-like protein-domain-containing protein [Parasitella parasitica]